MENRQFSAGSRAKSDCSVTYVPDGSPISVSVRSSVNALFGKAITATVLQVAAEFGVGTGRFEIEDDGALDSTVAARAEAALRMAGLARGASTDARAVSRAASRRDRARRARLYLPGDQPHLAINAGLFGADCLVFDLEDSVVEGHKFESRILVRCTLEEGLMLGDCEIVVRINPLSGPYGHDDLSEIVKARPHGIVLPKSESAADIEAADREMATLEKAAGIPEGSVFLMPLIESARGVLAAREIAAASPRNVALCFGREDFSRDIRATPVAAGVDALANYGIAGVPGAETIFARAMIVLGARAAGIDPLDSTFADVENEDGLARSCAEARALGFAGKGVLHPAQIPIVKRAFRPTEKDARHAEKIIAAFEAAASDGRGAISVDGAMVDAPVVEKARAMLREYRGED